MMSDVTDTIGQLADGQISLDDAAAKFRARQWPARERGDYPEGDPEPEPDGGFGEVQAAFTAGLISQDQYATLAEAAAEGIKSQMGDGSETKAGPVAAGTFVRWDGGSGCVDLVVKSGTVPGVDAGVTDTADSPAARVTVWEDKAGVWAATGTKVGVELAGLTRIPPLRTFEPVESKDAALVGLLARHEERVTSEGLPAYALPGARAVLAVYERGVTAWPGETKTALSAEQWALGRAAAFLDLATGGQQLEGYERDKDLLPEGHPARGGHG